MLEFIKFDVTKVKHAAGIAPIAPVDPDGLKAMGKTNDAVLFGGRTYYYVESEEDDDIANVAAQLPSSAADGYGKPFFDVFKEAGFDFYQIDKGMFAPAEVVINDLTTGKMSLQKEEVIKYMNNIKNFGSSIEFFDCMNNFGLSFEEKAILLTWIGEKTDEGIARANEL